ncbi:MAG TPA: TonB-dependent receptor [Terriglobales bacterium]|jgi:hypothetical protein|nr:TonB-dependent receptor [Terriglobales bacterium]
MARRLALALLIFCVALPLVAQLPTASLGGVVTDQQGAVVVGAKVTITSKATGLSREQVTGSDGRYLFTTLLPGSYDVRVETKDFAAREFKDVRLEVGHAETLDAPLSIAKAGEVVTVTGGEAVVELTQSQVQGQISAQTVENIPLNGRNFLELAFLLPGNRPATNFDPTKTNTLEVSSAGSFGRGGNITVDGGDNNDEVVGGTLMNFPQDGIQEFQIATNRYTAEVGRSSSSVINIITKSGANDLHGSAFFFFRHKELQGLPATFDRTQPTPPFDREQVGGSLGGPLKRDRAFWFFALENRNQDYAAEVGRRDFSGCPAACDIVGDAAPSVLDDFLLTSRVDFKVTNNNNLAGRYSFNRNQELAPASLRKPIGTEAQRQVSTNKFHSFVVDWTTLFSATKVNTLIFHFDDFINQIPAFGGFPATNPPGLAAGDGTRGNEIRFPSIQDGESFRIPQRTRLDRWQVRDVFSWTAGGHHVRFGGEWQNFGSDILFDLFGSGRIDTIEDFATQDRNGDGFVDDRDIPIAFTLSTTGPSKLLDPPQPPSAPIIRDTYLGFFIQDDWHVLSNLTLNLGLRWEFDNNVLGRGPAHAPCADPAVFDPNERCVWLRNILGPHQASRYRNFAPRLGFAWDPFRNGRTVIRGGYGIYYDRVVLEPVLLEELLDGRIVRLDVRNGSTVDASGNFLPDAVTGVVVNLENPFAGAPITGQGIGINFLDTRARHPLVQHFTFGMQQQLGKDWVASVDGVHNFGTRLILGRFLRATDSTSPFITCPDPPPGIRPCIVTDPATGIPDQVTNIESSAKSWYDGLLVSLNKRPTGGPNFRWGFNISYTLSKSFNFSNDDQIPFNGAEDQVNLVLGVNNLGLEKGYSLTDERHRFVFYGVFDLPWRLSLSPIWTMSSSVPIDSFVPALGSRLPYIQRNSLARDIQTGADLNAAIAVCESPGNVCAVRGIDLANVDPNLKFGDSFNSLDLRLTKTFSFAERHNLQLIGEVFNVFNVTNIRGFNNNNYSGFNNAIGSAQFNEGFRTAGGFFGSGGPRAFQFAVRYSF